MEHDLSALASICDGRLIGASDIRIRRVGTLDSAEQDQIAFCGNSKYRHLLDSTRAGAVILREADVVHFSGNAIIVDDPQLCFTRIARLLQGDPVFDGGIHPGAVVSDEAKVASSAWIGPQTVIEAGARLGERVYIAAGCYIGKGVAIGDGTRLYPHVVVEAGCVIGANCIFHPGVVIGSDGFGLAKDGETWLKIPQLGRVVIEDDVEVGANTTIDRGAIDDTVIHRGVKIDNLVQIAHNVDIGENTAIAACTGIAGSARIGKRCSIGGSVGILGHLEIADDVAIAATSLVTKSITGPGIYSSGLRAEKLDKWQKNLARFRELDSIARRLAALEKETGKVEE